MNIGKINLSKDIELELDGDRNFMNYYYSCWNRELIKKTNEILYNFAQEHELSIPFVCDHYEVQISSKTISDWISGDKRELHSAWTYELSLVPKKGSILNPLTSED